MGIQILNIDVDNKTVDVQLSNGTVKHIESLDKSLLYGDAADERLLGYLNDVDYAYGDPTSDEIPIDLSKLVDAGVYALTEKDILIQEARSQLIDKKDTGTVKIEDIGK